MAKHGIAACGTVCGAAACCSSIRRNLLPQSPQAPGHSAPLPQVMSQQTQLPRVIDYFQRWTARWPTVQALAAATQDEVWVPMTVVCH